MRLRVLVILLIIVPAAAGCAGDGPSREAVGGRTSPGDPVLNIAHRGASERAPENTLAAYDLALEHGADYIEQDVQITADGVLVVVHNRALGEVARGPEGNCTGPVDEKTLAQLETCDVGSSFNEAHPERAREEYAGLGVPTLEEVVRRYRDRASFYIDLKPPPEDSGMEEELLRLLDEYELRGTANGDPRVLVVSFSVPTLERLHELDPRLPLTRAYAAGEESAAIRETLDASGAYAVGINPWHDAVDAALVEAARTRCLQLYPYTVEKRSEMERLIGLGVDGIFTSAPARLDRALRETTPDTGRPADRVTGGSSACRR